MSMLSSDANNIQVHLAALHGPSGLLHPGLERDSCICFDSDANMINL